MLLSHTSILGRCGCCFLLFADVASYPRALYINRKNLQDDLFRALSSGCGNNAIGENQRSEAPAVLGFTTSNEAAPGGLGLGV